MGAVFVGLSEKEIELDALLRTVHAPSHGGQVVFLGMVRDNNAGYAVRGMRYEAYRPLAEEVLKAIAAETQSRWGAGLNIAIWHRIGELKLGEVSVAIVVGSPHRDEAFLANRYIIEELKKRVPIWKEELYEDRDPVWLSGQPLLPESKDGRSL